MIPQDDPIEQSKAMHREAERRAVLNPDIRASMTPEEIQEMVHELEVHQIELEMQNENLQLAHTELDAAREWMLVLGRKTAREKIASLLSIIARRDASLAATTSGGGKVFDLPLTREAMADYLGLTLETVSRQMSALKKDGVILLEGKRHVTIPDMQRLLEEAGDDSDGGFLT